MITRARDGIHKPKRYPPEYKMFSIVNSVDPTKPKIVQERLNSKLWLAAMKEEIDALQRNKT